MTDLGPVDRSPIDLDNDILSVQESRRPVLAEVSESVETKEGWPKLAGLWQSVGQLAGRVIRPRSAVRRNLATEQTGVPGDIAPGSVPESVHRDRLVADLAPEFTRTLAALESHPVADTPIGRRLIAHGRALLHRMIEDKTWPVELEGVPSQVSDALDQLGRLARHTGRSTGPAVARLAARIARLVTLLGSGRPRPVERRSGRSQSLSWRYATESSQPNAPPCALLAYGHREHALM